MQRGLLDRTVKTVGLVCLPLTHTHVRTHMDTHTHTHPAHK